MQHIERVTKPRANKARSRGKKGTTGKKEPDQSRKVATSFGYVDIWAGLELLGKGLLPLARQFFSSAHPKPKNQNRMEEAVLFQALHPLRRVGLEAIAVGGECALWHVHEGLGRKELVIRLAGKGQDLGFWIDPDITAIVPDTKQEAILAELLARQPYRGEVTWDRGQEGVLRCQARTLRATIRFSQSGREADYR